ncbi:MAG: sulfite exporter TauE/SafE family protein [Clostridia bacterium]|nr:sulfite exporter TauE/SafE family protein [Clostridia bacterium]
MDLLMTVLTGLLAGAAGAMGIGGGSVLIILLTVFFNVAQIQAQGINLLFFIPIAVLAVIIYAKRGHIKWRTVLPISAAGLLGVVLGVPLAAYLGDTLLSKIFAGILILVSIKELFAKSRGGNLPPDKSDAN